MSDSANTGVEAAVQAVAQGAGWRRGAGVAGAAIGVVAAGAAVGVAVERLTVGRGVRRKARLALDSAGPYGTLRGTPGRAVAEDGTELYYEADEPEGVSAAGPESLKRLFGRRRSAPLTVVFSHGYCLSQDSWHFQRAALRGTVRTVFWDQRSHGRSGRAHGNGAPIDIDLLGRDLKAVIDDAAPEGPLVLVGHSMGGMTMMALAAQYPELIAERVVGAAFVGTSAGGLAQNTYGLPVAGMNVVRRVLPGAFKLMSAQPELIEKGRRATADLFAGIVKRYSFGSKDVDPAVARFAERLLEATPVDVVAAFYPAFADHDKVAALRAFDGLPVLVLSGGRDLLTPTAHSEAIAEALPGARLVHLPEAGHLVMMENPDTTNEGLVELLAAAAAGEARPGPRHAAGARRRC
ncbi:alpha/beta fold hydrolase [Streptomyces sp. ISL-11]|uniref:alpha/beta fold hydrolase n=1 Tax=Streptomyces sp. ISL-11 TaxID=2819174 RepID=UPI001BE95BF8|nr:alpha/beta hydrolase [Streptomyces sp. ISL-11]MBT2385437.1 alpha/beta hydrolase [Streptomyces sp. ISL-11]